MRGNALGKWKLRSLIVALALLLPVELAAAQAVPSPEGVWRTRTNSEITIAKCAVGYCGRVSKVVVPKELYEANRNVIDKLTPDQYFDFRNPKPSLRNRPILGLQVLTLDSQPAAEIFDGEIYNPEDGNTYAGRIEIESRSRLKLTGCGFFNLICRDESWHRVR